MPDHCQQLGPVQRHIKKEIKNNRTGAQQATSGYRLPQLFAGQKIAQLSRATTAKQHEPVAMRPSNPS